MTTSTMYNDATFLEKVTLSQGPLKHFLKHCKSWVFFVSADLGKQELPIYMPMFPFLNPW